jgi:predicted  nucleic acid-binding Zn-ribbon protein
METTVEQKLKALYELQSIHTHIDKIRTVRGELPMEVRDLEDEVEGLETRINKHKDEFKELNDTIQARKLSIKDSLASIKKYETQLENVKNNREYEALTKEIEIQGLDIQVFEKKIKESGYEVKTKEDVLTQAEANIEERRKDLSVKREELDNITAETQKEEDVLLEKAKIAETHIDERLLIAYNKLRGNAKNGLAVVTIERDSCSGCFNKIPPQRQSDIRQRKKIIVCEHCGRILVDEQLIVELQEGQPA